jgi:uncharacterized protein (DUF58 family)
MQRLALVPRSPLLWLAASALPLAVLGAIDPDAAAIPLGLILALLLFAVWDASRSIHRLDGFSVELPPVLRLTQDRSADVPVLLRHEARATRRVRLGLGWPPGLVPRHEDCLVALPAGTEQSQLQWSCLPVRRGRAAIRRAYLEAPSPFGLWSVRRAVPVSCEVRIYPNLEAERKRLAALFLNRGLFGLHAQRQVGKGREFEKLREYVPGDGYDEIHWKATARRGHPITKVFQIERTQEVYVVVDASRLSGRPAPSVERDPAAADRPGSRGATILDRFLASALILGQAAEHQGDLFGVVAFADQVQTFLRARNGREHYSACREALFALEAHSGTPDFDEISFFLRTRLRRRALLLFLTSLEDPVLAEAFVRNMNLLAGQHLVLVNMVQPPAARPLFSDPRAETLDDLYAHLGGHLQWHSLRELQKVLQRRGVRFSLLNSARMSTELVAQYLSVKQRQLL